MSKQKTTCLYWYTHLSLIYTSENFPRSIYSRFLKGVKQKNNKIIIKNNQSCSLFLRLFIKQCFLTGCLDNLDKFSTLTWKKVQSISTCKTFPRNGKFSIHDVRNWHCACIAWKIFHSVENFLKCILSFRIQTKEFLATFWEQKNFDCFHEIHSN